MTVIRLLQACRFEPSSLPFPRICPYCLTKGAFETEVLMNTSVLDIQLLNQQSGRLVDVVTIILHIEMLKY